MKCENCGSDHTQRLEVAYAAGTQSFTAKGHTREIGDISDALGLTGHRTQLTGITQSALAQTAAPPPKRSLKIPLIFLITGAFCFTGPTEAVVLGLIFVAVSGYFGIKAIKYNTQQWPIRCQHWLDSWLCLKCGHVYEAKGLGDPQ